MYRTTFNLKSPKSKKASLVNLIVFLNGERIRISTKQSVYPFLWNFKTRTTTKSKSKIEKLEKSILGIDEKLSNIQHNLDLLLKEVDKFFLSRNLKGIDSNLYDLREHLDRYLNPSKSTVALNDFVLDYLKIFASEAKEGLRKQANGSNYSNSTINNYLNLYQTLRKVEKLKNYKLRWRMINRSWYYYFINWHEERGYMKNYIGKHVKDLKSLMRSAYEEGVHKNDEFRKRYFTKPRDLKKKVPLTLKEVNLLYDVDLPSSSQLDLARDVFLVGCYMGLRISDIKQITADKITADKNGKCLSLKQMKTKEFVKIPINSKVENILKKNNYTFNKVCEQVINRNIKIVGVLAGIEESKSKKISIHLSRHTFAKLSFEFGIAPYHIMQVTGHKSEKSFLIYINISPEQAIKEFRKHEFFQ